MQTYCIVYSLPGAGFLRTTTPDADCPAAAESWLRSLWPSCTIHRIRPLRYRSTY